MVGTLFKDTKLSLHIFKNSKDSWIFGTDSSPTPVTAQKVIRLNEFAGLV